MNNKVEKSPNNIKVRSAVRPAFLALMALMVFSVISLSACRNSGDSNNRDKTDMDTSDNNSGDLAIITAPQLTYGLPSPKTDGGVSVEKALADRRSRRDFTDAPLSVEQLSQLLWAAYGTTSPEGLRTAPSAGALYPLEVYAVVGNVAGIEPGVYRYVSGEHEIVRTVEGDVRERLSAATSGQSMVGKAPVSIFYSGVFERTTQRYGERGIKYVYMELGHSAENVYLQAEALGLGACVVGAFADNSVTELLSLPADEEPLYLMPVGFYDG